MDIVQIVGIGLATAAMMVILREQKPEFALFLSVAAGTMILLAVVGKLITVINVLEGLASRAQVKMFHLDTILKIIGIAYIAEFGAQVCRDANANVLASKIELAAKLIIMVLAIPIIILVLDTVLKLMP